jgi:hypothetical protein
MNSMPALTATIVLLGAMVAGQNRAVDFLGFPALQAQEAAAIAKQIGAIHAISGNTITLTGDDNSQIVATVQPGARILRINPGEKDLKNATPLPLGELKVGDKIRVRGRATSSGIDALEVILITSTAVDAVRDQIRDDWQKRGTGGMVDAVDGGAGNVTISYTGFSGKKTIVIHTAKSTVIRRYAPDSVKFEDAQPSTLPDIHIGDQLRARGTRSADGNEVTAEEIVAGAFPYIVGTIKSVDASSGSISVQDLLSKKTVQIRVTADSQLHKIPAEVAQRFAARVKSSLPPGTPGATTPSSPHGAPQSGAEAGEGAKGDRPPGGGMNGGGRQGGSPDLQQVLAHLPSSTLADLQLQKGDAVVILATQGTPATGSTAITLLSGVEPILQAAPNASQAMMIAPWSLGGAPGGDAQ